MASQQQASNTPIASRDSWQTPQWLFDWVRSNFRIEIDLAASASNAKLPRFYDIENDALSQKWHLAADSGWCNPPYSEPGKWLAKAWQEAREGFASVILVPTPNGEKYWGDHVFGKASEIIYINGRVAFELPNADGVPIPQNGNTRGSCLAVFNRTYESHTAISWINRDDLMQDFEERGIA